MITVVIIIMIVPCDHMILYNNYYKDSHPAIMWKQENVREPSEVSCRDLQNEGSIQEAAKEVASKGVQQIDVLINNAGI